MQPDSQIKGSDRARRQCEAEVPRLWLLFSQTMKNLDLVNTVYLTLQKSSAELKQLVRQSVVTKPLCDLPDADLKRCV